ncbi:MAG: hypothetical protein FWF59_06040 [Turicibacter sp.]|nr:hypothetical protein [Turicibacter sp.]
MFKSKTVNEVQKSDNLDIEAILKMNGLENIDLSQVKVVKASSEEEAQELIKKLRSR